MAFDEGLAERLRGCFAEVFDVDEKRMFGGLAMMVNGHMCCGIANKDALMVRVGKENYEKALQHPFAREMDFTGKPLGGFIYVDAEGIAEDSDLQYWVQQGLDYVFTLPPKSK